MASEPKTCPNCGKPATHLYVHDGDCEICDGELDTTHCGCYHDEAVSDGNAMFDLRNYRTCFIGDCEHSFVDDCFFVIQGYVTELCKAGKKQQVAIERLQKDLGLAQNVARWWYRRRDKTVTPSRDFPQEAQDEKYTKPWLKGPTMPIPITAKLKKQQDLIKKQQDLINNLGFAKELLRQAYDHEVSEEKFGRWRADCREVFGREGTVPPEKTAAEKEQLEYRYEDLATLCEHINYATFGVSSKSRDNSDVPEAIQALHTKITRLDCMITRQEDERLKAVQVFEAKYKRLQRKIRSQTAEIAELHDIRSTQQTSIDHLQEHSRLYAELRRITDGGSESATHADAVQSLKEQQAEIEQLQLKLKGSKPRAVTQCTHCGKETEIWWPDSYEAERVTNLAKIERLQAAVDSLEGRHAIGIASVFLALWDARAAAESNADCAEILRLYCTDGDGFIDKYAPHLRPYKKEEKPDADASADNEG